MFITRPQSFQDTPCRPPIVVSTYHFLLLLKHVQNCAPPCLLHLWFSSNGSQRDNSCQSFATGVHVYGIIISVVVYTFAGTPGTPCRKRCSRQRVTFAQSFIQDFISGGCTGKKLRGCIPFPSFPSTLSYLIRVPFQIQLHGSW